MGPQLLALTRTIKPRITRMRKLSGSPPLRGLKDHSEFGRDESRPHALVWRELYYLLLLGPNGHCEHRERHLILAELKSSRAAGPGGANFQLLTPTETSLS